MGYFAQFWLYFGLIDRLGVDGISDTSLSLNNIHSVLKFQVDILSITPPIIQKTVKKPVFRWFFPPVSSFWTIASDQ